MEISKISLTLEEHEFCEKALKILRSKLPNYVSVVSVTLDGSRMRIDGRVEKAGSHEFALTFEISASADGRDVLFKLKKANVTNTAWIPMPDFALVNAALAKGIPDSTGVSYSWGDEQLRISIGEIVKLKYGIVLQARIAKLEFSHGLSVVLS